MMPSVILVAGLFCFTYFIYNKLKEKYSYWTRKNIVQCKPWPLLGNLGPILVQKQSISELFNNMYNQFPNARFFGIYRFLRPTLIIKDLDLIKSITIRDSDTFPEHEHVVPEEVEPLFAKNIVFMKGGTKWRQLRSMLSPVFTSSKLRSMYPFILKCADQFVEHYENCDGIIELEAKDLFSKYINDVIATVAFGVECNTFANPRHVFYSMARKLIPTSVLNHLKVIVYGLYPALTKFLQLTVLDKSASNFFRNVVIDTIAMRAKKGIVRLDALHILTEARKGLIKYDKGEGKMDLGFAVVEEPETDIRQKLKHTDISDDDLIAQVVLFILAGFEAISTALMHCAYELAVNPDIQQKLYSEIDQHLKTSTDKCIGYEEIIHMKYLDMVVTETLRKWPPFAYMDRCAVKPYKIEPKLFGEEATLLPKGTTCIIPLYSIHRDPKYYPNPEKFDPERFSNDNKHLLTPLAFLPFGMGPKSCIGSRLAIVEIKVLIVTLLSKFEIVPILKTSKPKISRKRIFLIEPEGGLWVGLKKRGSTS